MQKIVFLWMQILWEKFLKSQLNLWEICGALKMSIRLKSLRGALISLIASQGDKIWISRGIIVKSILARTNIAFSFYVQQLLAFEFESCLTLLDLLLTQRTFVHHRVGPFHSRRLIYTQNAAIKAPLIALDFQLFFSNNKMMNEQPSFSTCQ